MWFFHLKIWKKKSFFFLSNQKSPHTFHTRFCFWLGLHNAKIGQRTKALVATFASGCVFTQSTKLFGTFWHQLKIDKIVWNWQNSLARFGINFQVYIPYTWKGSNHSIYHIAKWILNLSQRLYYTQPIWSKAIFYTTLLVKSHVICNMLLRSTSFQNFIDIMEPHD